MFNKAKKFFFPSLILCAFFLIWHSAASRFSPYLFPTPFDVLKAIIELHTEGRLWKDIGISLTRLSIAYIGALTCAIPLGLILGRCINCLQAIDPIIQLIRPISPIAWFPLAVLWFGIGNTPAIFIIFLAAFFPMLLPTISAVRNIPSIYYKVSKNFGAKPLFVFFKVVIPAAFPGIMTGLQVALGAAWIHLVAGEMLGADSGLGYQIIDARNFLRTDRIMAGMLLVGLLGLILNRLITTTGKLIKRQWGGDINESL